MAHLFSITCATCNTRLKVRDRSVIGQILACPKCHSMVLVEPPAEMQNPPAEVEQTAPPSQPPALPDHGAADKKPANFEQAASLLDDDDLEPPEHATAATADASPEQEGAAPHQPPLLPGADWSSPKTQRLRTYGLYAVSALAGTVLAVAVAAFAISALSERESPAEVAQASPPEESEPLEAKPVHAPPQEEEVADEASSSDAADPPAASVDPPPSPEEPNDAKPNHAEPDDAEPDDAEEVTSNAESGNGESSGSEEEHPPGLSPRDDSPDSAPAPEPDNVLSLSEGLAELAPLWNNAAPPEPAETKRSLTRPTRLPPLDGEIDPTLEKPLQRAANISNRLQAPLLGIDFTDAPLDEFLRFVSGFTATPVSLDPAALHRAGVAPDAPVTVQAEETTIGEALASALEPLGLTAQAEETMLWITAEGGDSPIEERYEIGDLAADDAAVGHLADLIQQFVAPASWKTAGGAGEVQIDGAVLNVVHTPSVQFEVQVLLSKLRAARGQPQKRELPASLARLTPRWRQAEARLASPLTLTFVRPVRLAEVLDRIAEAADVHILVDWTALWEAGWSPEAKAAVAIEEQTLSETLAALLAPRGLTYAVIDAGALQITTPAALLERRELELHDTASLRAGDLDVKTLPARLQQASQEHFPNLPPPRIHLDSASGSLLALASQPQQIAISHWLDELRAAE